MKTRRYVLFLIVAILTFLLGVTAAAIVDSVNPFARNAGGIHFNAGPPPPDATNNVHAHHCHS
jgi:hypothetical protein